MLRGAARRSPALLRACLAVSTLSLACAGEPDGWVEIDGRGGEAWLFEREVTGRADPDCDEVLVETARGRRLARGVAEWSALAPLPAGESAVVAICRIGGREVRSVPQRWTVRLADRPVARVRLRVEEDRLLLDGRESSPSEARPDDPIVRYAWTGPGGAELHGETAALEAPRADGEYRVDLEVTDARGARDRAAALFWVRRGRVSLADPDRPGASWIDDAIVYGVVPMLYAAPDGTTGLRGVLDRLDELDALGVDTLWLSPITDAPDDDFGYAVTDHFALDERFGTPRDLRALVSAAHARGMRVILDFVANHTSDQHRYYLSAEEDPRSPYAHFYHRDHTGEITHYFDWEHLPNLNLDEEEVARYVIEALRAWVRAYDVDGFRADAAWGPARRAPAFWPRVTAELLRMEPDLLLLAEASARDPYWGEVGFHAAYDWTWELGRWSWREAFEALDDAGVDTAEALYGALADELSRPDPNRRVLRFLNNNDTGERFVTRHGPGAVAVSTALLMTLPGVPALFSGDEVGAEYRPYDEGPPLSWRDRYGLRHIHRRLIALRRELPALRSHQMELLPARDGSPVLGYKRRAGDGPSPVLVLLNFSTEPARALAPPALRGRTLRDRWAEEDIEVPPSGAITVPPRGLRILVLRPDQSAPLAS